MFLVRASFRFSLLAVPSVWKQERQLFVFIAFLFSVNIVDSVTEWCFVGACLSCFFPDALFLTHECAYRKWISSLRDIPPYVSINCIANPFCRYNFPALWSACIRTRACKYCDFRPEESSKFCSCLYRPRFTYLYVVITILYVVSHR